MFNSKIKRIPSWLLIMLPRWRYVVETIVKQWHPVIKTLPMQGRGSGNHFYVSVCYRSSECYECFKSQRYQQKALETGNKINIEIELKFLGLKVMTVISLPW